MINGSFESTTASDGTYTIPGIAEGSYGVSAISRDTALQIRQYQFLTGSIPLILQLLKNVMSGYVTENGSTPIEGAEVTMDGITSTTDSNGYYSIAGVIAGSGRSISASHPDYAGFVASNLTVAEGDNTYSI